MGKAIGYTRVSTTDQATDGVSLEAQAGKMRAWCEREEIPLAEIYSDRGISGRQEDRPGLHQAIDACRRGDCLLVYSLSRLARSTRATLTWVEALDRRGVALISLSEKIDGTNAAGKMMFRMLAVLAEFESDQIGERTSLALRHMQNQGLYIGGHIPFGYSLEDGSLVRNYKEQIAMSAARVLTSEGHSMRSISEMLAENGFVSRSGSPFHPWQIARMVRSATFGGR